MIKLNGYEIKPTIFPDGTSQVWKIPEEVFTRREVLEQDIIWDFENESEFIHLAQLCDLLQSRGLMVDCLFIDTLPYARQDKRVSNQTTFAKYTFMKLLKTLPSIKSIATYDEHSKEFSQGIISSIFPASAILGALETNPTLICYPDKGAEKRYKSYPFLNSLPSCSLSKDRDQSTGYIKNLFLNELISIEGEVILIVDDLCDGGMTFKLAAEKLLTLGAKEVNLYTTHGIYSKGVDTLRESGINRIFNRKGEV